MKRMFKPFDETLDPKYLTWKGEDETDKFIPPMKGFVTDFIYATRGREVASLYGVWGALFAISSVLQRDAWFTPPEGDPWLDKDYLNFYLLFLGPAGSGKSSSISIIQKIISACNKYYRDSDDPLMRKKECAEISDVSTPEAFLGSLARHSKNDEGKRKVLLGKDKEGKDLEVKAPSNGIVMASEFASLLNRSSYNANMSTNLLTLYDCPSLFRWNTVKRGNVLIPDVYMNIIGAATADGMASTVDPVVMQDGFMSRVIMAYVPGYTRKRHFRFRTNCGMQDLIRRLLWISKNNTGTFTLSKEADKRYRQWYDRFMDRMNKNPEKAGYLIRNRVLALKVAVLLKISEYSKGTEVEVRHLDAAFLLISRTYKQSSTLMEFFMDARVGACKKAVGTVIQSKKGGITLRQLMRKVSRYDEDTINKAVRSLWMVGNIQVIDDAGKIKAGPQGFPLERYVYERVKTNYDDFGIEGGEFVKKPKKKQSTKRKKRGSTGVSEKVKVPVPSWS